VFAVRGACALRLSVPAIFPARTGVGEDGRIGADGEVKNSLRTFFSPTPLLPYSLLPNFPNNLATLSKSLSPGVHSTPLDKSMPFG
jgi:hypothetical protein